jgi:hypothetical protein
MIRPPIFLIIHMGLLSAVVQLQPYHNCELETIFVERNALYLVMNNANRSGSLWCRQSQQSFNTSTPPFFIFPSYSLHVSAPTGHSQVRYTIRCFQGLFLLQHIRCTYTT